MAYIYKRGRSLWCRVKKNGAWKSFNSTYAVGDESKAIELAEKTQREIDRSVAASDTVNMYARVWLAEREKLGNASHQDDVGRITNHVLPDLGDMRLVDVRPRHVRDLVRKLRAGGLAPRTVINIFGIMRTMFSDAIVDEKLLESPCRLKSGDLPDKVDSDSEWRALATYATAEVLALISDQRLPPERRMLHALKAMTGVRHGEAAGLRWRHWDVTTVPLGRLLIATSYNKGRTKTNVVRRVPVHPTLAAMLATWRREHWAHAYGSEPGPDDLIVPTRTGRPISANDAGRVFKRDLGELELRVRAGDRRSRGGHDLRSWHITTLQEAGAPRPLIEAWTHTKLADVMTNYSRFSWSALCAEMVKLELVVVGDALAACDEHVTRNLSLRNRWSNTRPRRDSKPYQAAPDAAKVDPSARNLKDAEDDGDVSQPTTVTSHVTHAGLLRAVREFVVTTDPIAVVDELVRRGRVS